MVRKSWDMTSTHSLEAAAEWLRKNADALLVLVIRGEAEGVRGADVAFALHPAVRVQDAADMVMAAMPELPDSVMRMRAERAKEGA